MSQFLEFLCWWGIIWILQTQEWPKHKMQHQPFTFSCWWPRKLQNRRAKTKYLWVRRGAMQSYSSDCYYACTAHMLPPLIGLPLRMNGMRRRQSDHVHLDLVSLKSDHACFDYLSCKTYAKHSIGATTFWPLMGVVPTR